MERIILMILLWLHSLLLFSQTEELVGDWQTGCESFVLNFSYDSLNVYSDANSSISVKWYTEREYIILTKNQKITDSLMIVYLSNDTLILDLAIPRNTVVKVFTRYVQSATSLSVKDVSSFLNGNTFSLIEKGKEPQVIKFNDDGEYISDGINSKWHLSKIRDNVFICIEHSILDQSKFYKIESLNKKELTISDCDRNYMLILR